MAFISRQLLKVIEWKDNSNDTLAYRYPMTGRDEIMKGCQLIVRESQVAILVSEGRLADVYPSGRYKLDTGNIPIITKLNGWKYGFESPLKCEVYYINTKQFINQKWGTSNPVMMRDQDFGMVQFRGFGQFTFRVGDPTAFLKELLGTGASFKVRDVIDQLRRTIVSGVTEAVAASNVPALDLAMKYSAIGEIAFSIVAPKLSGMGLDLSSLDIENLSLTEESMAALSKRTNMNIIGNAGEYTQYAAADSMRTMAENAHKAQGINPGAMVMSAGLGGMVSQAMQQPVREASESTVACAKCGTANKPAAKFCCNCGNSMGAPACPKCGAKNRAGAKFCHDCGTKLGEKLSCPKCKAAVPAGVKFCPDCGAKI